MDLGLDGRRVLVVGGSYGIGRASAELFAGEGAEVMIVSRSADNLNRAADEIAAATGRQPTTLVADVTEAGAGERLAAAVAARWQGLDVLVTAVGGSNRSAFAVLSDDEGLTNYTFNVLPNDRDLSSHLPPPPQGGA